MQDLNFLTASLSNYAANYRSNGRSIHPAASAEDLRKAFCVPLNEASIKDDEVIRQLINAAEPGLVGNTDPGFFAWVMGASDPVGVAADWLTSLWGQNSAIYQTAPAAAIAEEAVSAWLLDLLDLPRESSTAFVTGATMAGFVCLAAARGEVLARAGFDIDEDVLQQAPPVSIFLSNDAHVSNFAALRYLGFGRANIVGIPSDDMGLMRAERLSAEMQTRPGPKIIITQAGHINSGGFEDFETIASLAKAHDAWMHVDGAFGLWARVLSEKANLTDGLGLADSWSVDGHKWLQLPYDSGFAIIRHQAAHMRAMAMDAGYLNHAPEDGRNPAFYGPELSRRARGFAAWAVMRSLGRNGIEDLVRRHCNAASLFAEKLSDIAVLNVMNKVELNQVVLGCDDPRFDAAVIELARRINEDERFFVRTAQWKSRTVLRFSIISQFTTEALLISLAGKIKTEWADLA